MLSKILRAPIKAFKELYQERYLTSASALAYTTLLSMIPLLSAFIYIASYSEYFHYVNEQAKFYAMNNLLPTTGSQLTDYIDSFSKQANQVPTKSFIFLIVTAVLLIMSIDNTMNLVWRKKTSKKNVLQFILYISCIFLIPLIIAATSMIGAIVRNLLDYLPYINLLSHAIPLMITGVLLSILYWMTARRAVKYTGCFISGIATAALLEAVKHGFSYYITHLSNYDSIYGALAILPIFLIWLYILWSIIIYGGLIAKNLYSI